MKVYLAGPITGQTYGESVKWRYETSDNFDKYTGGKIIGYSPMRGKAYNSPEDKAQPSFDDSTIHSITGINIRDFNDVKTSDAILVNFLECKDVISIGTVMEIAWARAFQIPVVIVMQKDNIHQHGLLTYGVIVVDTLEDGVNAIIQILLP